MGSIDRLRPIKNNKKRPRGILQPGPDRDVNASFLAFLIDSERTRDLDGFTFVGLNPCNSKNDKRLSTDRSDCFLLLLLLALVLRGLDILTSKETIEAKLLELTFVTMKNCAIVKDNYTGVSRGFAFVEYNSIHVPWISLVQGRTTHVSSAFSSLGFRLSLWKTTIDHPGSGNRRQSGDCSFLEE